MKNILAENLLRFGVKNLSESDKRRLSEVNPQGNTISPEAQAQIDKMIQDSAALLQKSRNLTFTGTGAINGQLFQTSKVGIAKDQNGTDIYFYIEVKKKGGDTPYVTSMFIDVSKDGKTPVIKQSIKYPEFAITGQNVQILAGKNAEKTSPFLLFDYQTNKASWDTIATDLIAVGNKYITTGVANN